MNKIKRKIKELFIYFLRKLKIKSIYIGYACTVLSIPRFLASSYGLSQSLSFLDKRIVGSGNEIVFVYVRVPESRSPKHHGNFLKKPCLAPQISETLELNKKRLNNLLTNFFCSFQIRKDPLSDIGTLKCIIPHAFCDHTSCDTSWCGYPKEGTLYKHRSLPYNKDLYGQDLKKALTVIFNEYATDTVAQKLIPFANSPRNESLNGMIGSKKPQN